MSTINNSGASSDVEAGSDQTLAHVNISNRNTLPEPPSVLLVCYDFYVKNGSMRKSDYSI